MCYLFLVLRIKIFYDIFSSKPLLDGDADPGNADPGNAGVSYPRAPRCFLSRAPLKAIELRSVGVGLPMQRLVVETAPRVGSHTFSCL